ncbi:MULTISPECIES: DUF72 domain-containing protein [unclassified Pseudomonas]|uniref:DUF72 domain-containing protein n=1 Tax=unclassified Pseudomonas TaxID=196821 RepID=UPI0030D77A18
MSAIHIGISGWRYTPWRGGFYPEGLTQKRELQFASRAVNSIEINGSFYALQTSQRYAQWYADTPDRIECWRHGKQPSDAHLMDPKRKPRDVFCFFDNDIKVRAPFDTRQLLQRFELDKAMTTEPGKLPELGVLP